MTKAANQDQADYWASDAGRKWITYETTLDLALSNVNRELIRQSIPKPGERVLDIGCGTGDTSRAFSSHVAPDGTITAIDISGPLLDHARTRTDHCDVEIQFHQLDAQTADIPGAPFDLVISRFGVMFFENPIIAFENIRKHMKPGGRIILAAWAGIDFNPWFSIPAKAAISRLGQPEPSNLLIPGPLAFQDIEHVENILRSAGFKDAFGTATNLFFHHPGPLSAVAELAINLGPATRIMQCFDCTPQDADQIQNAIYNGFEQFADNGGINIPTTLNFYAATNSA